MGSETALRRSDTGGSGTFVWIDSVAELRLVVLTDRSSAPNLGRGRRFPTRCSPPRATGLSAWRSVAHSATRNGLVSSLSSKDGWRVTSSMPARRHAGATFRENWARWALARRRSGGGVDARSLDHIGFAGRIRGNGRPSTFTAGRRPRSRRVPSHPRRGDQDRSLLEFILFSATHGLLRIPGSSLDVRRRRHARTARFARSSAGCTGHAIPGPLTLFIGDAMRPTPSQPGSAVAHRAVLPDPEQALALSRLDGGGAARQAMVGVDEGPGGCACRGTRGGCPRLVWAAAGRCRPVGRVLIARAAMTDSHRDQRWTIIRILARCDRMSVSVGLKAVLAFRRTGSREAWPPAAARVPSPTWSCGKRKSRS